MRKRRSTEAVRLSEKRFGYPQLLERIPLAARAAWSFFHKDKEEEKYERQLLERLEADLKEYQVEEIPGAFLYNASKRDGI